MAAEAHSLKIKLQLYCGDEIAMGPGKADLLEAIARQNSISGAARVLGMSYRRAWLLVDAMNRCWREPLVATAPGGAAKGGARLTPLGAEVLQAYQKMQDQASKVQDGPEWAGLQDALRPAPKQHQKG